MTNLALGDLSINFQTRLAHNRLKTDLQRLTTELTSGVRTDLHAATGGDLGALAGIERSLGTLSAYRIAASEAALFTGALQRALDTVQTNSTDLAPALLQAGSSGQSTLIQTAAASAEAGFATVVSVLNTQVAGRTLLGGTDTGAAALASSDAMLADLTTATAAETTAAGVEAVVTAWFDDPGGGFETSGYLGSTTPLSGFRIGPDETAAVSLTAADPDIRDILKSYAMAALVARGALDGNPAEQSQLIGTAAERMLASGTELAETRAAIGSIEARIDTAAARNSGERAALEIARTGIVAADPYRTATDLQAAELQLDALYTLTARLSRLSLTEYLR